MTTRPLKFSGDCLSINYATSAAGSLRIGLLTADGQPIDGFTLEQCTEMVGDRVNHTVRWKSGANVAEQAGRPVRLRFVLKDADLYSFQFIAKE